MELNVTLIDVDMRLKGVFVRLSASRDAEPAPCYHRLELETGVRAKIVWTSLRPTAATRLVWEACIHERAPEEEGGELEPVIVGGAVTSASGAHRVELRDFYADTNELLGVLEVRLEGLPELPAPTATAEPVDIIAIMQERYEAYYRGARPGVSHDRVMRVPTFRFYGAEVQASYLTLMRAGMDARFARSVLDIVLEDAGMTSDEFVEIGERQLRSGVYLQATTAIVARLGEFVTFTSNILRYRADMSSPALERRELIEKIVPHVRGELGGDCEDLALEIYFCFNALRDLSDTDDRPVRVAATFANLYVPFITTTVATSPAAGGDARGELLHVFTLALTLAEVRKRMQERFAVSVRVSHPWIVDLPNLAPLEGTNWCDALHLPLDRFYGSSGQDVRGLRDLERREGIARELAPEMRNWPTRIRQQLGAPLTDTGFSSFYRRVVELWGDFSDQGACCFSILRTSTERYGVGLGEIASKGDYELREIFRHDARELDAVRRAMRTVAPVPAWRGEIRMASVEGLRRTASIEPKRISRLHADVIVYHFRSETLATSERVRAALRKLEVRFELDYRARKLPPKGEQKYIAIYAREKA